MVMLEYAIYAQLRAEFTEKFDPSILEQLGALCGHFKKAFCYPSQETLLKRLRSHGNRAMSRRTLNRHLNTLEALGYIERVRRHQASPAGMQFHSTLYKLTRKCWDWLKRKFSTAGSWFPSWFSRVPFPAQHTSQKKFIPGAATQKPGGPPPGNNQKELADHGEPWDKKKAAAKPHLADLRRLLA